MNPLDDLLHSHSAPAADDGIALMTGIVAAVTWLRRGAMPGMTVWDVIEQALRWRSGTAAAWSEPDPLRAVLRIAVADQDAPVAQALGDALRVWLATTAQSFNDGVDW